MSGHASEGTTSRRWRKYVFRVILVAVVVWLSWSCVASSTYGSRVPFVGGRPLDTPVGGAVVFATWVDTLSSTTSLRLADAAGGHVRTLDRTVADHAVLAVSPDGTRLAYPAENGDSTVLRVIDPLGDHRADVMTAPFGDDQFSSLTWSPDGRYLAFVAKLDDDSIESVYVVAADGGSARRVGPEPRGYQDCVDDECVDLVTGDASVVDWGSERDHLYYITRHLADALDGDQDMQQLVHVAPDGHQTRKWLDEQVVVDRLGVSPDGRWAAYGFNGEWWSSPVGGPSLLLELDTRALGRRVSGPTWTPYGQRMAYISDGKLLVADADGSDPRAVTQTSYHSDFYDPRNQLDKVSPVWSPDGRHIAYAGRRNGSPGVYFMNADGTGQTQIATAHDNGVIAIAWVPDRDG